MVISDKPYKDDFNKNEGFDLTFYACLFYYFIEYFRPHQKYSLFKNLHLGDVSVGLFIIAFFATGKSFKVNNRINFILTIYFIWAFICSLIGINFDESWKFLVDYLKFYLIYFLTINTIKNEKQLIYFISFMGLIYFSYTNYSIRNWLLSGFSGGIRGSYFGAGFLSNPNDMSAALSSFFGISLYMIYADRTILFNKFKTNWFHIVNTIFIVLGILTTSTRGGAVALAACLLSFWKNQGFKLKYAFLVIVIGLSFVSMLSDSQREKYERIGTEQDESGIDRIDNWKIAWKMMNDHPIFGVGPWNYVQAKKIFYNEYMNLYVQHNIFLQASTELGYPGLIVLLILLYYYYKNIKLTKKLVMPYYGNSLACIATGLEMAMLGFIVSGLFITTLYYPFFWLNLTFSSSLYNIALNTNSKHQIKRYS